MGDSTMIHHVESIDFKYTLLTGSFPDTSTIDITIKRQKGPDFNLVIFLEGVPDGEIAAMLDGLGKKMIVKALELHKPF